LTTKVAFALFTSSAYQEVVLCKKHHQSHCIQETTDILNTDFVSTLLWPANSLYVNPMVNQISWVKMQERICRCFKGASVEEWNNFDHLAYHS